TSLFAFSVLAQPPTSEPLDRVVHLTHAETDQQLAEIATDLRGITQTQVSVDTAQRTLTLHGSAAQINAAEWLLNQLENMPQQAESAAADEYRLSSDDIVRVFRLAHAPTPQSLQELAFIVRSMADIRRLFTCTAPRIMTVRGDGPQIALAEWLVKELDRPSNRVAQTTEAEHHM